MYTVKLTRSDPTVELMGPKKGKMMARNQMGMTTGNRAAARLHMLLHSCIPIAFSHTKYNGVHANPNVINCTPDTLIPALYTTLGRLIKPNFINYQSRKIYIYGEVGMPDE